MAGAAAAAAAAAAVLAAAVPLPFSSPAPAAPHLQNGIGTGYTTVMITPSSGYGGAPLAMRIVLTVRRQGPPQGDIEIVGSSQAVHQNYCDTAG